MNFNEHSKLNGQHAFLSASNYHWLNYNDEKLATVYYTMKAKEYGTVLHEYAKMSILLHQKLQTSKKTLNMYVNDAIGFGMVPEQILYYSENCFGTADAISFEKKMLRIHDLKTGSTKTHFEQLLIYAALFCLEYTVNPDSIHCELRIYQNDDILFYNPEPYEITDIMVKIRNSDKIISGLNIQEGTNMNGRYTKK